MPYDPDLHHRRSIRLKGYDYSQCGLYFITICTQNRACLFGKIEADQMQLNAAGQMVAQWWGKLPEKFPQIFLDAFTVMPNHFHGIIGITPTVGADPRVCPDPRAYPSDPCARPDPRIYPSGLCACPDQGAHVGAPLRSVSTMVQWFKTMSTNAYIRGVKNGEWPAFSGKIWQRNFYEHIIRDEKEWEKTTRYIQENPKNWQQDEHFV